MNGSILERIEKRHQRRRFGLRFCDFARGAHDLVECRHIENKVAFRLYHLKRQEEVYQNSGRPVNSVKSAMRNGMSAGNTKNITPTSRSH